MNLRFERRGDLDLEVFREELLQFLHLIQIFQLKLDLAVFLAATLVESIVAFPILQPNIEILNKMKASCLIKQYLFHYPIKKNEEKGRSLPSTSCFIVLSTLSWLPLLPSLFYLIVLPSFYPFVSSSPKF
jgi:hypothetical protein